MSGRAPLIVPCFNERRTISEDVEGVKKVGLGLEEEIVMVDDGSTDESFKKSGRHGDVNVTGRERDVRKRAAVKTGVAHSAGGCSSRTGCRPRIPPEDVLSFPFTMLRGKADGAYGSRFAGGVEGVTLNRRFGNKVFSWAACVPFGAKITGVTAGYEVFKGGCLRAEDWRPGVRVRTGSHDEVL